MTRRQACRTLCEIGIAWRPAAELARRRIQMADHGALDCLRRAARVQLGLSQAELPHRAGVTRQAVSAIESGKAAPTMAVALRLARALGRGGDDLLRLVDELPGVSAELLDADDLPDEDTIRVQVADVDGRII